MVIFKWKVVAITGQIWTSKEAQSKKHVQQAERIVESFLFDNRMQSYGYDTVDTRSRNAEHKWEASLHPECDEPIVSKSGQGCNDGRNAKQNDGLYVASVAHETE